MGAFTIQYEAVLKLQKDYPDEPIENRLSLLFQDHFEKARTGNTGLEGKHELALGTISWKVVRAPWLK